MATRSSCWLLNIAHMFSKQHVEKEEQHGRLQFVLDYAEGLKLDAAEHRLDSFVWPTDSKKNS